MKHAISTILILLFVKFIYAQNTIKGEVIDINTKEPLAFVNIIFNNNPQFGTITDIDGKFKFNSAKQIESLTLKYVGYESLTVFLDRTNSDKELKIEMESTTYKLNEIVVHPKENPAHRIIRKAIENKEINNPENIGSFKYKSYNKLIADFITTNTTNADSINYRLNKRLKGGHLLIMESVTERKFIAPDNNEEIIIGTKASGFKFPDFAPLATDMQPFSFYDNIIPILDINYLNPVSKGSFNKYNFELIDTLYQNTDTTFIVAFKPIKNKRFNALSGLLYINTNQFAIQNVIAEPFEKGLIDIKIEQQYTFLEDKQWFPSQLNYELVATEYPSKKIGTRMNGRTYISNVELYPIILKKDFSIESISMHKSANKKDSLFWMNSRIIPLNEREETTYQVIDSLGKKLNFDGLQNIMAKLSQNRVPIKFIDIDISETLIYNKYEGTRLGMGLYTNERISEIVTLGGFFGYGLKDKKWKYGGKLNFNVDKESELKVGLEHTNSLTEVGSSFRTKTFENRYDWKSMLAFNMDDVKRNSVSLSFRSLKYAQVNLSLNHYEVNPLYEYAFQPDDQTTIEQFSNTSITFGIRYVYKEELVQSFNQRMSLGTKYPVLNLKYSRGIRDLFNSQFEYNKIEAQIDKSFLWRNIGKTTIRLEGGFIDKPLPYSLLFTSEGSYDRDLPIRIKNSFQTVAPYEFLSDRYANLFFAHIFNSVLFEMGRFKPHISFHHNMGWGSLKNKDFHKSIQFKTKEKGLFESGLQFDNLVRIKYLNLAYLGFGVGAYYRYGAYSSNETIDNFAFKFSMTFSTK
jgi:hypothetical protein